MINTKNNTAVKRLALAIAVSTLATAGLARTTDYTHNSLGQVTSIDGPRIDVTDVTTYDYDLATANLLSVTNAVGHVTTYSNYTGGGLAQTITTPNGAVIDVQYDWKGNVLQQTVTTLDGSQTTVYGYNKSGSLTSVTLPNSAVINYEYDGAQRLVAMSNSDGERIEYTLDSAGNITTQTVKDSAANIVRQHTQVFDDLNRLREHVGGTDLQTTKLDYDADSRNTGVTDPKNNPATQNTYDALSRLTQVVDPANGTTVMTYNSHGLIETVTDPRGLVTRYDYNGYGELEKITSPDTGITSFTHDEAGNVTSRTNANGTVVNYTYDALNRLTEQSYPADPTKNVLFTYDDATTGINGNPNYGKGQLTRITHFGGQIDYQYDQLGRLVAEQRSFGGQAYTTEYSFNAFGQLAQMAYPSGRLVSYGYDSQGRLLSLTTQESSAAPAENIVSNLQYLPFGPTKGFNYGNGLTQSYNYDLDYRLTDIVSSVQDWVYRYDLNSNIESITNNVDAAKNQTYGYDELNRLTTASGPYGNYSYSYDAVGNRTQRQKVTAANTVVEDYTYATDANQLTNVDETTDTVLTDNRQFVYSESGQLILDMNNDRTLDLAYDENDRLSQVEIFEGPQLAQYTYNPLGQRITKTFEGESEHIHYDSQGKRIAETDTSGNVIREYIYLGQQVIAMIAHEAAVPVVQELQVTGDWSTIVKPSGYENALVFAGVPSKNDADYGVVRVDNSAPGQYQVKFQEWDYLDGVHAAESLPVLLMQPGIYPQSDGSTWEVGTIDVSGNKSFSTLTYQHATSASAPKLLLTIQSNNESEAVAVRARNLTATTAQVAMYEQEAPVTSGHASETVAYLAIFDAPAASSTIDLNGITYSYSATNVSTDEKWLTVNGAQQLSIEEEQSLDSEVGHCNETISVLNINNLLFGQDVKICGGNTAEVRRQGEPDLAALSSGTQTLTLFVHNDHLGTPKVLTNSAGAVIWEQHTTPFGEVHVTIASGLANIQSFPGQWRNDETGLSYNYYRDYDPGLGRYVQSDPIGLNGGLNTYGYVSGNPINKTDPYGLVEWTGTATTIGVVPGAGLMVGVYNLESECGANGQKATAQVLFVGPAAGPGIDFGVSKGDILFNDHSDNPAPWKFEGMMSGGMYTAGLSTPFGGYSGGDTSLGDTSSEFSHGETWGFDAGLVVSMFGGSALLNYSFEPCECN